MFIEVVKSKIHRVTVTQANLNYIGSITIDEDLMDAANIIANEKVSIVNNNNGERFETYVIKGERGSGVICLNGAAARKVQPGDIVNVVMPLGNSFSLPENTQTKVLLIGGGVGTAPLLYLGETLLKKGCKPTFLLGARSKNDLLQLDLFEALGNVYTTTEDGSYGEKGYVTMHSVLKENKFDLICTCGPKPMMMAVAKYAAANGIECEVSLENTMACGVGACLCCVENTKEGHVCVCKEGPVFNIKKLLWQI